MLIIMGMLFVVQHSIIVVIVHSYRSARVFLVTLPVILRSIKRIPEIKLARLQVAYGLRESSIAHRMNTLLGEIGEYCKSTAAFVLIYRSFCPL